MRRATMRARPQLTSYCIASRCCSRWLPRYNWRRDLFPDAVSAAAEVIVATPEGALGPSNVGHRSAPAAALLYRSDALLARGLQR